MLALCGRAGARASAGIAPTPFVARVVAERTPPGEVRSVDDGRAFLAPLPLDVLPVDVKVHDELRLLGLRTVGEFADLPRGSVFDRFGSAVARAHALARGEYGDMVRASAPPRRIRARRAWDDAIGSREQLVFALRVVVDEISGALARDGFAALRLELRLDREDAGPFRAEPADGLSGRHRSPPADVPPCVVARRPLERPAGDRPTAAYPPTGSLTCWSRSASPAGCGPAPRPLPCR